MIAPQSPPPPTPAAPPDAAGFSSTFLRIGLLSFGGPAAQIALMHRILVDERRWLTEKQFLDALGFCMVLPGPEAMQLATYAGWRLRGIRGGLIAGALFVGPGAAVIFVLATIYALYGNLPLVQVPFAGIKAAVLVIVIEALLKVSRRALKRREHWIIAALSFVALFFFSLPFPVVILTAALWGLAVSRGQHVGAAPAAAAVSAADHSAMPRTLAIGLLLWLTPLAILSFTGPALLADIGWFFARLAVVTFGGAYAVLAYMAQDVVTGAGWLDAGQMMDGLGLAETTPGPLILVTQFVAFLAGYGSGGLPLAFVAAALALWATFVPCFLWIFAFAPSIDRITANPRIAGALTTITAAVVGVILNLSIWFALHVLFGTVAQVKTGPLTLWVPDAFSIDWRIAVIAAMAAWLMLWRHAGIAITLVASAGAACALSLI